MKHVVRFVTMIVLVFILMVPAVPIQAAEPEVPEPLGLRPDAPTYALHGPYWVGTMEMVIEDSDRPLPITVWYPALNPDNLEEVVEYDIGLGEMLPPELNLIPGHALLAAEADRQQAPYPLVIYSPANTASRLWAVYYQEHLASYGFVVIAVDHPGTSAGDYMMVEDEAYYAPNANSVEARAYRPQDIIRVLDYAETLTADDGQLEGLIDMEHVAVTGWSLGGQAALAVAGAQMDFNWLADWCDELPAYDSLCNLLESGEHLAELMNLDTVPDELWSSFHDDRVDAIIVMAINTASMGPDGLAPIEVPVMALGGTADTVTNFVDGVQSLYDYVSSPTRVMVGFEGGNHYIFGDGSPVWREILFDVLSDKVWDMDRVHDLTNHFSTAFLLDALKGDTEAHAALLPENVTFPGLSYETTMK